MVGSPSFSDDHWFMEQLVPIAWKFALRSCRAPVSSDEGTATATLEAAESQSQTRTIAALTGAEKIAAKRRAHRAGRPYPNLVDNMQAAKRED